MNKLSLGDYVRAKKSVVYHGKIGKVVEFSKAYVTIPIDGEILILPKEFAKKYIYRIELTKFEALVCFGDE